VDGQVVWASAGGMARYLQGGWMAAVGRDKRERVGMQAAQWFAGVRANAQIADLRVGLR